MNFDEKFEKLYSNIVTENMKKLENLRKEAKSEDIYNKKVRNKLLIIGIILFLVTYISSFPHVRGVGVLMFFYLIVSFIIYLKFTFKLSGSKILKYKNEFKANVIKSLLDSFNENIEYYHSYGIKEEYYNEAEFGLHDRYRTDDLMKGILKNNCNFEMSEVVSECSDNLKEMKTFKGKTYFDKFEGIFVRVETPKSFNARLYLRKNYKNKNVISRTLKEELPFYKLKVELDSQEFEEYFDVYCTDKIIAMQLLTADIMQLLFDFKNEIGIEYELTIKNNCIYIRFMSGKMFETVNLNEFSLDKNILYKYYKMLFFSFELTNKLIRLINETEYN